MRARPRSGTAGREGGRGGFTCATRTRNKWNVSGLLIALAWDTYADERVVMIVGVSNSSNRSKLRNYSLEIIYISNSNFFDLSPPYLTLFYLIQRFRLKACAFSNFSSLDIYIPFQCFINSSISSLRINLKLYLFSSIIIKFDVIILLIHFTPFNFSSALDSYIPFHYFIN